MWLKLTFMCNVLHQGYTLLLLKPHCWRQWSVNSLPVWLLERSSTIHTELSFTCMSDNLFCWATVVTYESFHLEFPGRIREKFGNLQLCFLTELVAHGGFTVFMRRVLVISVARRCFVARKSSPRLSEKRPRPCVSRCVTFIAKFSNVKELQLSSSPCS